MSTISKILAVALAVALVGVGAFGFLSLGVGTANATADGDTYASVTKLTGESKSGTVDEIEITSTGYVEWEHLGSDADHVTVETQAKVNGEWQTFASETYDDVPSASDGDYSYDEVTGELLAGTDFTSDDFSADEDGDVRKEYVTIRVVITVVGEDGETCTFTQVHKVKTIVTNLHDPTVDGDNEIGGEIIMDDTCPDCDVVWTPNDGRDHNGR